MDNELIKCISPLFSSYNDLKDNLKQIVIMEQNFDPSFSFDKINENIIELIYFNKRKEQLYQLIEKCKIIDKYFKMNENLLKDIEYLKILIKDINYFQYYDEIKKIIYKLDKNLLTKETDYEKILHVFFKKE